jgi:hypothetical protein
VALRCRPDWRSVTLADLALDLVGEVGDQLESLRQIGPPARMAVERCWNVWEPGQRTRVDRRQRWETPVEHGGHVAGSAEVTSEGGCLQVQDGVLLGSGREGEQVPARLRLPPNRGGIDYKESHARAAEEVRR